MPFTDVADRVWVARYPQWDVNVTLVGGSDGLLVVDTHGSDAHAREVVDDVRRLGAGEVTGIINTHWHFDHSYGNRTFRTAYGELPIIAHETAAEELARWGDADVVVLPDRTFSSALALDLGDRMVELVHPGKGHTGGDLVLRVPDVDVLLAGDLVEESATPSFGDDSWPMDWPLSLDVVLALTTSASLVVPGHGAPVDRDFVEEQRNQIGIIAETIRDLAGRGVPLDQAVETGEWPWPRERLGEAVRRGYEQLPRSQKRLPLI
ncbi:MULTISPECIES: MBL fold metallo-hydrolase [unclassified Nocardioides]|uniref:MBL fold metallo-hydrolase n=1 Tax=Nocardioides sp. URHA0032 TaxID=1380388 RepID=UPI00048F8FD2|nr:MBL fold metallo-hydrolase [Nocardioides sp. URHA0032]